jgi:hypothetical protein
MPSNERIDYRITQKELLTTPIIIFFGLMFGGIFMPIWVYHIPEVDIQ